MANTCYKELGLRYHDLYWTETLIDAAERRPWVRSFFAKRRFRFVSRTPRCCLGSNTLNIFVSL